MGTICITPLISPSLTVLEAHRKSDLMLDCPYEVNWADTKLESFWEI